MKAAYLRGVKAGAAAARELLAQGISDAYEFDSLVLRQLGLVNNEGLIRKGSDMEKPYNEILKEAWERLADGKSSAEGVTAAVVPLARSAEEALLLHHELTGLSYDELPEAWRKQLKAALAERFPE